MNLSDDDAKAYKNEVAVLKRKYNGIMTLEYRRESSRLGHKYKLRELCEDEGCPQHGTEHICISRGG